MWATVSVSCRICLVALVLGMLFSPTEANVPQLELSCCHKRGRPKEIADIKNCYKQTHCDDPAYLVIYKNYTTQKDEMKCLAPRLPWLQKLINTKKLACPPEFSKRILQMQEDDME